MERVAELRHANRAQLGERRALVVGCGALGSATAMHLVRAGVGHVRVVDRDVVEQRNLVDQVLFTERDAALARPKAEAAARALRAFNSESSIEGVVADFSYLNARELARDADVVVDGVDNLETKLLLNDLAVATGTPYVYGGCAGSEGAVLAVLPGRSQCLRCLWPTPRQSSVLACEEAGALPGVIAATAALQFTEACKILLGLERELFGAFVRVDIWTGTVRRVALPEFLDGGRLCPACELRDLPYLDGRRGTNATELCGDDTVLISVRGGRRLDTRRLIERQRDNPSLRVTSECVRFSVEGCQLLVFTNGNTLIHGTTAARARAVHARYVAG
jgi:molybdopterin/thiamine biosynthesis adenylyltransferase